MSGKATRSKGRRGQTEAANLLRDRDFVVADLTAGVSSEDFLAVDTAGITWAVEAKNTAAITIAHRRQAMAQGNARRARWMLMSKIHGTSCWLIQRQGIEPIVWRNKSEDIQ